MPTARIRFVTDDTAGSRFYRCQVPADELCRRGHDAEVSSRLDKDEVPGLDVIVFHRQPHPGALAAAVDANAQGKLTVCDLDDDYWAIPPSNPEARERWGYPGVLETLEAVVREVRLVTTSSPGLADVVRPLNPRVRVLPNMLVREMWPSPPKRAGERIVVGWAGGGSHLADLRLLSGVVEQLLAGHPDVEFRTHGLRDVPFVPSERLRVLPGVPLEHYPALLATFDVGLAPLEDIRFNRGKSDLKVIEYGAAGAASVASKVGAYASTVRPGETGSLAGSPKDWLKAVGRLVEDAALRERLAEAGRAQAEGRFIDLDANIGLWERAYGLRARE